VPAIEFDPIQEIQVMLRKYPHVRYEASGDKLLVHAEDANGFPIAFHSGDEQFLIACLGWHKRFDDPQSALDTFSKALSGICRLEVWKRGAFEYRWIMQHEGPSGWVTLGEVARLFTPFWRRRTVHRLQNHLLEAA
jgi:hypothetical protein